MKRYLIIGPAWVGDAMMAHTLFQILKQQDTDCLIHLALPSALLDLAEGMPEIADTFTLPFAHGALDFMSRYRLGRALRARHYTHAIILPNSFKSALVPFFARIPIRIGWKREGRSVLLSDARVLTHTHYPRMIDRFAALAYPKNTPLPKTLPTPCFTINSKVQKNIALRFQWSSTNVVTLCIGAAAQNKRWPPEHYGKLARTLIDADYHVALLGTTEDLLSARIIEERCAHHPRLMDYVGKTSLQEAIYLISLSAHVVANDSGLMHLACALGIPCTALYGPTSPDYAPPLSVRAISLYLGDLACRPCHNQYRCPLGHRKCLQDLSPEFVLTRLLAQRSSLMAKLTRVSETPEFTYELEQPH